MIDFFDKSPLWFKLGILFPLACLNLWLLSLGIDYLQPLVSIFIVATLLSFLLDFPIGFFEEKGLNRNLAIALVFLVALIVLSLLAIVLVPLIFTQLQELIVSLPKWVKSGNENLQKLQTYAFAQNLPIDIENIITETADKLTSILESLGNQFLDLLGDTINTIFSGVLVIILTIFLVFTGEQLWEGIGSWFPKPWDKDLRNLMQETFETYFSTQAILSGILSVAQTLVLSLLGVPYSLLFGVTIGVISLIPYASTLTIVIISLLLMLQNIWLGLKVLVIAILVGQINDNVIAPRLMGDRIGLNPIWLITSLFIGGKIAGVLGLIIAVPLASVIKEIADKLRNPIKV